MGTRSSYRDGMAGVNAGRLVSAVFFVLISFGPACLSGNPFEATAGELSQEKKSVTEWEGNESEPAKPFAGIIATEKDWKALWKKAFRKKAPAVNFKRYAVACVFLGHYPGWWYHIGFGRPHVSGSTMVVSYSLADLRVELRDDGTRGPWSKEYGSRGQYKMRVVEKKHGFSMRLEQVGKPQIPLKSGFDELLGKNRLGVPDEK